ncbi:hypothetical protein B9Z55_016033 [Caenorhabditis nigoni]|uniref:C2H2-type domain-containing protein n=1 Tax=Caenorhabditis nigoni TaxID=1611254 RepID=A0A2G5UCZ3_9PELO|nr:hypothetical protein B9Z55_016033 [Caenorhabditis nigoni]
MSGGTPIEVESFVVDQVRCPDCSLTCLQKNIYRHMTQIHEWTSEDCKTLVAAIRNERKNRESTTSFACSSCRVLFRSVKHLVMHKKRCSQNPNYAHPGNNMFLDEIIDDGGPEEVVREFEEDVPEDSKPSTSASTADHHGYTMMGPPHRQVARPIQAHQLQRPPRILSSTDRKLEFPLGHSPSKGPYARPRGNQMKCPECPVTTESVDSLINHCQQHHQSPDRKFLQERRAFETMQEFKKWFDQRQEDTCTSLTKRTGHGGETLYRCHRVGKYRSVAKSRKSNPRKVDQTCTAYLKVQIGDDGVIWATGCFTHIGHDLDHKLLWLTETQENYVRELIDLDWTSDQIFFFIRNEYKDYDCKLKYVSKNDIRNITVRYDRLKKAGRVRDSEKPKEDVLDSEDVPGEVEGSEPKIPRTEDPEEGAEPKEEEEIVTSEVVDVTNMIVVDDVIVEDIKQDEEEEFINVVDDDTMPELQKVA